MAITCLLTEIVRSAAMSSTIWFGSTAWVADFVSSGRLTSTPFWVRGRAAMKMIRRTSSTSMRGVTFMSALACGISPVTTRSAPKCL